MALPNSFILFLIFTFPLVALPAHTGDEQTASGCQEIPRHADHPSIHIVSDASLMVPDLTGRGNGVRGGNGSPESPYLIESWQVNQNDKTGTSAIGQDGPGILVANTQSHIIIRDVVVLADGSPTWPAVTIRNAENVVIERVFVIGSSPIGGVELHNARAIQLIDVQFGGPQETTGPELAFANGGFRAQMQAIRICNGADVMLRSSSAVSTDLVTRLVVDDLIVVGNKTSRLAIFEAESFFASNVVGRVHVVGTLIQDGTVRLRDSSILALDLDATNDAAALDVSLDNVRFDALRSCSHAGAAHISTNGGSVVINNTQMSGYPRWLLRASAFAVTITNSTFDEGFPSTKCALNASSLVSLDVHCESRCGPSVFNDNHILAEKTSPPRMGLDVSSDAKLLGSGNLLKNVAVRGPVDLTQPVESRETADSLGFLTTLTILVATLFIMARRGRNLG